MRSPTYKTYRADIDGLRALAVLSVVLFHADIAYIPGGFTGVDIFFVISGYLISSIILRETEKHHFSFRDFYARRIKRILPALLVVLLATWVIGAISLLPSEYAQLGKHIKSAALFTSNFTLSKEAGYFDTLSELKPLLHLWSLAVEEQFYLLWPILLTLAAWLGLRTDWVMLTVIGLSLTASLVESANRQFIAFFLPHTRFWELAVGGLLAHWHHTGALSYLLRGPHSSRLRDVISGLGISLIVASLLLLDSESPFPSWRALVPTLGAALLIAGGPSAFINRVVLSHPGAVFVGLISYPLYLWHWPMFTYARILDPDVSQAALMGLAVLAALLAWLTYRFVETPIRSRRYNHHLKSTPVWLMAGLIGVGLVGYMTHSKSGYLLAQRPANDFHHNSALSSSPECMRKYGFIGNYCLSSENRYPLAVALVGDSHANRIFWGLAAELARENLGLLNLSGAGCLPLYDTSTRNATKTNNCRESMNQALDIVIADPSIRTVYLAARWAYYTTGEGYILDNTPTKKLLVNDHSGLEAVPELIRGLGHTLRRLEDAGKQVIVVHGIPELGFDPAECLPANEVFTLRKVKRPCGIPVEDYSARQAPYRAWMSDMLRRHPEVEDFDPAAVLCDERYCHGKSGSLVLYSDSHHLNVEGSRYLMHGFASRQALNCPPGDKSCLHLLGRID